VTGAELVRWCADRVTEWEHGNKVELGSIGNYSPRRLCGPSSSTSTTRCSVTAMTPRPRSEAVVSLDPYSTSHRAVGTVESDG